MMWKKERDTGGVQGSDWIQDLLANSKHSTHWSNWFFLQTLNKKKQKHLHTTLNASFSGQTANIKPISFRLEIV